MKIVSNIGDIFILILVTLFLINYSNIPHLKKFYKPSIPLP